MQFVDEFKDVDISKLRTYISNSTQKFEESQLYSAARDEKFIDISLRMSKFRAIIDPVLFEIAQDLLNTLTANNDLNSYTVVRNDVTHIVYAPGGFFKQHRDYLSLKSNIIEEYTLLICVTPDELAAVTVGGETQIYVNPDYIHTSQATIKPGNALLFRKDLIHEGLMLQAGGKEIISLNVWVTRKQTMNDGILFITFPENEVSADTTDPILEAAYGQSYVLSLKQVMRFPQSSLSAFCRFSSNNNTSNIFKYKCVDATYEQFGIVFRAMCGMYLSPYEAKENAQTLDFFGLSPKNLLIDFEGAEKFSLSVLPALEGCEDKDVDITPLGLGLSNECCKRCSKPKFLTALFPCSKCKQVKYCGRKCQTIDWNGTHKAECGKDIKIKEHTDFIICPSEERTTIVSNLATECKLPYIRFSIIFAEGTATFGGGMTGDDPVVLKMEPVWASFGDYENILFQSSLMTTSTLRGKHVPILDIIYPNYKEIYTEALSVGNCPVNLFNGDDGEDCEEKAKRIGCDAWQFKIQFNLQVAKAESSNLKDLVNSILGYEEDQIDGNRYIIPMDGIILPSNGEPIAQYEYFHVDQDNKTCFTANEADLMCEYLEETEFIDRIKKQLNNIDFQLPQVMQSNSSNFCNESVYGTFNFMLVSGVLRFDQL